MKKRNTWLIVVALATLLGSTLLIFKSNLSGNTSDYGKLSELGRTFANSLQTACELKDAELALKVAALVDQYAAQGKLPSDDRRWIIGIVKSTESDDWAKANSQINQLLAAQ